MNALCFRLTLLALALLSLSFVRASDSMTKAERDAEAKEFAEEDVALRGSNGNGVIPNTNFTGKFTAYTDAQIKSSGDTTVIGRFDSSADEPMLVRAINDKVKAELKKLSGNEIVVNGRARLNGKYLYANRVMPVGPGYSHVSPAGGL